jgi:5-formyltetrahydrofolate cyclo-ligase
MKTTLRQKLRERLKEIPAADRQIFSEQACALIEKQAVWQNAKSILFYAPLPDELDIWPLLGDALAERKMVVLPKFNSRENHYVGCEIADLENDLSPGEFGIREPASHCPQISLNRLDFALVPGVGFDLMGRRLGRGKGFYDRLLTEFSGKKCGICFDIQLVEEVPTEPHDVRLNYILTPTRWLEVVADARFK